MIFVQFSGIPKSNIQNNRNGMYRKLSVTIRAGKQRSKAVW